MNYVIKTNNITPLEKLCQNLIYSEIKDEDYEDTNVPKLLRTFQYALEYLNAKQSKLEQANNKLDLEYKKLLNSASYFLPNNTYTGITLKYCFDNKLYNVYEVNNLIYTLTNKEIKNL